MTSDDNSKKVLLPVEIKTRELSAKLMLAAVLAGRGYDVYIGNKIQHTALDKINPDIYFELSGKDHAARLQRLNEAGIRTLILETEGDAFSGVNDFSKRVEQETLKHADCYCAWGNVAKKSVEKEAPGTNVELTGNPRFDLLQKPHRTFYAHDANQLNQEYGEFVLFNTNFSMSNGENSADFIFSNFDENDSSKEYILNVFKKQVKIFGEFLHLIAEVAEKFPNKNIIIRPHPGEKPSFYENILYAYDNVHVEKRLEVRPWIMAAEAVIHNSCTTGVTSALLDTPVIAYVPDELETLSPPNEVSNQCETVMDVCDTLSKHFSKKSMSISDDKKNIVRDYIDNIDYLSVERIADVVDSVASTDAERTTLETDNKLRLRRTLVRAVGSNYFEELYVKKLRGEKRHKFPYTPTTEIESIVEQFADEIKPAGLQIKRLPYTVNGFRLWCDG